MIPDHPFCEEILPNIQPESPLVWHETLYDFLHPAVPYEEKHVKMDVQATVGVYQLAFCLVLCRTVSQGGL